MTKAMFIIDMPQCCGMCPMFGIDVCRKWNLNDLHTFPKDCQLREVPIKESYVRKRGYDLSSIETAIGYANGWNACIDEILGN